MKNKIIEIQEELIKYYERVSTQAFFDSDTYPCQEDVTELLVLEKQLAELKEQEQQPEQSAEEFCKGKGIHPEEPIYWDTGKGYITLFELMEEYRQQGVPSDEEISRKLDALNFKTSKEREDAYDAIDYVINKWKKQ